PTPWRDPARVTWLPRCSAPTPSPRSISARFCPYWPNNKDASRLSSNASTTCVAVLSPAKDPLSDREERNGSGLQHRFRAQPCACKFAEQAVASNFGNLNRPNCANHRSWGHDLNWLQIRRSPNDLARITSRFFEQDIESAATTLTIERGLLSFDDGLEAVESIRIHYVWPLMRQIRGRRSGTL